MYVDQMKNKIRLKAKLLLPSYTMMGLEGIIEDPRGSLRVLLRILEDPRESLRVLLGIMIGPSGSLRVL